MSWVGSFMSVFTKSRPAQPDAHAEALDATLRDLRRVSSELRQTNGALLQRVQSIKKEPDDTPLK